MPLFEYVCDTCQKDFTLLQSANVDKEDTKCPDCDSPARYQFSTFAHKIQGVNAATKKGPVTSDELPNKNVLNLPLPRLRSELP